MPPAAVLEVLVKAQGIEKTTRELRGMDAQLGKTSGTAQKSGGMFAKFGGAARAAALGGVAALGAGLVKTGKDLVNIERLNAQTAAAIKSTGGAAGVTAKHITDLADKLEKMSGVEAESIQAGQNLLLTFTKIKGTNFDAATKSALDMSVAMGTDMSTAAMQVGKALNDPIKGVGALRRVGVQLTKQQEAQIKAMTKAGDTAGAQKVILKELETQFGGSAKAAGQTMGGQLQILGHRSGDVAEKLVTALMPALSAVTAVMLTVAEFFGEHQSASIALVAALGLLAAAWTYAKLQALGSAIAVGAVTAAWVAHGVATKVSAAAQWLLNAALTANPIGLVVVALVALVAALVVAYKKSETFRKIVDAVFSWLKAAAGDVFGFVSDYITTTWNAIVSVTTAVWNAIKGFLTGAFNLIKSVATTQFEAIRTVITTTWTVISTVTSTIWNAIKAILTTAWNAIKAAAGLAWDAIELAILNPIRSARELMVGVVTGIATRLSTAWATIKGAASTAWDAVKEFILSPVRAARDAIPAILEGIVNRAQTGWDNIKKGAAAFAGGVKSAIVGAFEGAKNAVVGFINTIIKAINEIPGVPKIKEIGLAKGGVLSGTATGAVQGLARGGAFGQTGGLINAPMALMGEQAPRHPEFVIPTNPAYRGRAQALLGQAAGAIGLAKGGFLSAVKGAAGSVLGGAGSILGKLPGVGGLPDWLKGTGSYVLKEVGGWIKDQIKKLLAVVGIGGGGSGAGTMSGTNAKAAKLAQMFGATITSGYRSPAHNAAVGGAAGSSHMKGSPSNPGAHDFVPASPALLAAALKMGAKWVDNHDFGSGLHSHVSWFAKGGVLGSYANGTDYVPRTGPYMLHRGESVAPASSGPPSFEVKVFIGNRPLEEIADARIEIRDRATNAVWRAG